MLPGRKIKDRKRSLKRTIQVPALEVRTYQQQGCTCGVSKPSTVPQQPSSKASSTGGKHQPAQVSGKCSNHGHT